MVSDPPADAIVARSMIEVRSNLGLFLPLDVGPSLSPSVARELVNDRAVVWLSGLTCLSESIADILADHEGSLSLCCFSLTMIPEAAAGALARHQAPLSLVYFDNLPARWLTSFDPMFRILMTTDWSG